MEQAVPTNFDARLNAVKTAARTRVFGRYGLADLFREHRLPSNGRGVFDRLDAVARAGASAPLGNKWQAAQKSFDRAGGWRGLQHSARHSAKNLGKNVAEFGREAVFGSPLTVGKQLQDRYRQTGSVAKTIGQHAKEFYLSPGAPTWMKALSLGMPALELGNIAMNGDPNERVGDVAHALTGLAAAPFTARLGLPGMAIQGLAQGAGRSIGSKFDHKAEAKPFLENVEMNVPQHLKRTLSNSAAFSLADNPAATPYTTSGIQGAQSP